VAAEYASPKKVKMQDLTPFVVWKGREDISHGSAPQNVKIDAFAKTAHAPLEAL
jgi:hypothetical protein